MLTNRSRRNCVIFGFLVVRVGGGCGEDLEAAAVAVAAISPGRASGEDGPKCEKGCACQGDKHEGEVDAVVNDGSDIRGRRKAQSGDSEDREDQPNVEETGAVLCV